MARLSPLLLYQVVTAGRRRKTLLGNGVTVLFGQRSMGQCQTHNNRQERSDIDNHQKPVPAYQIPPCGREHLRTKHHKQSQPNERTTRLQQQGKYDATNSCRQPKC